MCSSDLVVLLLLGLGLMFVPAPDANVVGFVLLLIGATVLGIALSWKRTCIRLSRDGTVHNFRFFKRPAKARQIVDKIRSNIERVQAAEWARRAAMEKTTGSEPDLAAPPETSTPPPLPSL